MTTPNKAQEIVAGLQNDTNYQIGKSAGYTESAYLIAQVAAPSDPCGWLICIALGILQDQGLSREIMESRIVKALKTIDDMNEAMKNATDHTS